MHRVICHLDVDCFYAQVEMQRVSCPADVPFAVTQWGSVVAVNYVARAYGVQRFDTLREARQKCPSLRWEHSPTYAPGETRWQYHPEHALDRQAFKLSLEPYRMASRQIYDVLGDANNVTVERNGMDEAFLNLTEKARCRLQHAVTVHGNATAAREALSRDARAVTYVLDCEADELQRSAAAVEVESDTAETEALYFAGCLELFSLRSEVKRRTGYELSAGIAKNRFVAKAISATRKPNQQTLLTPGATKAFMFSLPITRLKGFGGKLGDDLSVTFMAETCGALWNVHPNEFIRFVGDAEEANAFARRIRGEETDNVIAKSCAPKSILVQKVFVPPTNDESVLLRWLNVLAMELVQRIVTIFEEYGLRPYTLNIKAGDRKWQAMDIMNRTFDMPWPPDERVIADLALRCTRHTFKNAKTRSVVSPVIVDGYLLSALNLRSDSSSTLVAGQFVVAKRQLRLDDVWNRRLGSKARAPSEYAGNELRRNRTETANGVCEPIVIEYFSDFISASLVKLSFTDSAFVEKWCLMLALIMVLDAGSSTSHHA
jgi:DNA polymerase eta